MQTWLKKPPEEFGTSFFVEVKQKNLVLNSSGVLFNQILAQARIYKNIYIYKYIYIYMHICVYIYIKIYNI